MLNRRVGIILPPEQIDTAYGLTPSSGTSRIDRWAAVDWSRGAKSLREGAMDAYDTLLIRMNWGEQITRECKVEFNNRLYKIDSFHADYQQGTIQMTCTEIEKS